MWKYHCPVSLKNILVILTLFFMAKVIYDLGFLKLEGGCGELSCKLENW
jgi:ssDNA-specific exonuclease RecJ